MKYYKHSETGGVFAYESEDERQQCGVPDLVEMTPEEIDARLNPPPTPEQIEAQKVALVQAHMDAQARALRYDDIATACTYAEEPAVPKFQAEGQAFRAWRSDVWAKCYDILSEVQAGTRDIPTDAELIAELPALQLPA